MRLHDALKHYQAMGLKIVPCRERSKKLGRKAVADQIGRASCRERV